MDVLAFEDATALRPHIPEYVITRGTQIGQNLTVLHQNNPTEIMEVKKYESMICDKKVTPLLTPEVFRTGSWFCVEKDGLVWFIKQEEWSWRAERAIKLLRKAISIKDDPVGALTTIRSCADVCGMNIVTLMSYLETHREYPGETLVDIFLRVKPTK